MRYSFKKKKLWKDKASVKLEQNIRPMKAYERDIVIDAAEAVSAAVMCFGAESKEAELAIKRLYNHLDDLEGGQACKQCSCASERIYDV